MRTIWRCEPGNLVDYRPWPTFHGICDERFEALRDALTAPLDAQDVGASVGVYLGELIVSNTHWRHHRFHVRRDITKLIGCDHRARENPPTRR